jgi:hypothetical protein
MQASGGQLDGEEQIALASQVQRYLMKNAAQDPEAFRLAIRSLVTDVASSGLSPTPENVGSMAGVILAGMFKHFDAIGAGDTKRIQLILSLKGLKGDLETVPSGWKEAFAPLDTSDAFLSGQDSKGLVYRMQGRFDSAWAQNRDPSPWARQDVLSGSQWLNIVLAVNGF